MAETLSYKRIRMATEEDVIAGYSLIAAYIGNPEAALSVIELILDLPGRGDYPYVRLSSPPSVTPAAALDDEAHNSITSYASSIGLGEDITANMLRALAEKKQALAGGDPSDDQEPNSQRSLTGTGEDALEYNATLATILLSLLPNLTTLRIFNVPHGSPLDHFLLQNNSDNLPTSRLQKLQTVQLHPVNCQDERCYDYLRDLQYFRYFHRLPEIHTFSLEGFEDYQAEYEPFPPKSSGIRKIHIGHSDMSSKMTATILGIPKVLEEFSYSTYGLMNTDGGSSVVDHRILGQCLFERRGELRMLDLDACVGGGGGEDEEEGEEGEDDRGEEGDPPGARDYPPGSIGRLDEFASLTHLSIRIGLLLGYDDTSPEGEDIAPSASYRLIDALPRNLRFLRLYGYMKGGHAVVDKQVAELVEKKSDVFPNLVDIEGVDELIPGVPGTWDPEPDEDDVWERSPENLDWAEVA